MNKLLTCFFLFLGSLALFSDYALFAEEKYITGGVCNIAYGEKYSGNIPYSVSVSVYESLKGIRSHRAGRAELSKIINFSNEEDLKKIKEEIEALASEKDSLLFNTASGAFNKKNKELQDKIKEKTDLKNKLEQEILENEITLESTDYADMEFILKKPDDGIIFERAPGGIEETAELNDLDLVVYGTIIDVEEYQVLELRLWNNLLKKDTVTWRTAFKNGSLEELISQGIKEIKTGIIGREWAEISVTAPDNAMIYIDGVFSGIGRLRKFIVKPGIHEIRVRKKGNEEQVRTVEVEERTELDVVIEMINQHKNSIIIQTFPAGADVYLDSIWKGISPLKIEIENFPASIMIKKAKYDNSVFFVESDEKNIVNIDLKPDVFQREEFIPDKRRKFYNSFGRFILSIPFTALFFSMVEDTGEAYNREYNTNGTENIEELLRLQNLNQLQYNLYVASLGMNIFMFSDTILKGIEYVRSVEYFSR